MKERRLFGCAVCVLLLLASCSEKSGRGASSADSRAPLPRKIIDLSPTITEDLPVRVWGHKMLSDFGFRDSTTFEDVGTEEPLYVVNSYWTLFNHAGPHVDAPNHMMKGAKAIDEIALDELMGRARVLDSRATGRDEEISLSEVEASGIQADEIFLLLVGYTPPSGDDEVPTHPYLSEEAAEYLASLPVKAFATDAFSVESARRMYEGLEAGTTGYEGLAPLHRIFLTRDIPVIEQLTNVESLVGEQNVVLVGFPLKVQGSNGSPIRAAALIY